VGEKVRTIVPELQPYWDWRAAGNFIGGGAGAGLLFFTALAAQRDVLWLDRTGLLALALVAAGLGCVWLELGRKLRALNVILRPGTSWMSREALVSMALFPLGLAAIILLQPDLALAAAAVGLVFLYCQSRLLKASKGIPAWREPAIIPLIISTGLAEGGALFAIIAVLVNSATDWAVPVLALLIIVRAAAWATYRSRLTAPGRAPKNTAAILNDIHGQLSLIGHLVPLALLVIAWFLPATEALLVFVAGLLVVAAGWYLKLTIVTRASYNQGFAINHAPARTPGYARAGSKPGWT
jgi:phenylacetyl-CoA:acceptor oxidoreductase 26-kDa subunit